ncbi:MAG: HesB/IscA family protein [bacterium]
MFKVTSAAAEQVKAAATQGGAEDMPLRLAAQKRSDGTIEYKMGFDYGNDDDIEITTEGVKVVMAPEYVPLLDQATLDFTQLDDGDKQFIFLNPEDASYAPPASS